MAWLIITCEHSKNSDTRASTLPSLPPNSVAMRGWYKMDKTLDSKGFVFSFASRFSNFSEILHFLQLHESCLALYSCIGFVSREIVSRLSATPSHASIQTPTRRLLRIWATRFVVFASICFCGRKSRLRLRLLFSLPFLAFVGILALLITITDKPHFWSLFLVLPAAVP